MAAVKPLKLNGTDLIHGDSGLAGSEVAPSLSVTTTFRTPNPQEEGFTKTGELDLRLPTRHVYSRYTQQDGLALTYSSGLSASYAALVFYRPKRVAIRGGYHGCHATIEVYKKNQGSQLEVIDLDAEYRPGDLCWLETPLNPTGESRIATKYFGGHSDLLSGILIVKTREEWNQLQSERTFLGSMMGSLESWLLLRSLRTLHLRVPRQSASATVLAQWLNSVAKTPAGQTYDGVPGGILAQVWHSSLQGRDQRGFDPAKQMQGGWNATFAILFTKPEHAYQFPHALKYFVPATSLGGVESLVEHRIQSDLNSDPRLVRLSIGVEEVEDLKEDLKQALKSLSSACFPAFSTCIVGLIDYLQRLRQNFEDLRFEGAYSHMM
ncbi:cystathionine gamma-synthase [Gymnopilus junonius]|uniref:Cystathionine gamma-synthase n=1 Tax=Gymnopilus junonius TaxID=109634 RepID=A0A9P5P1P5_GYMJU|nr:cystathionine gamma-synthase [Gymnopilus junonius]